MSYFVETVKRLLQAHKLVQNDLSRGTGLQPSHVSHIMRGIQADPKKEDVPAFADVVGKSKVEKAEVLRAFLLDQLPTDYAPAELIEISIRTDGAPQVKTTIPKAKVQIAPDVQAAFDKLAARCPTDSNMRALIIRLAKMA